MDVQLIRTEKGILEAQCDAPFWRQGERLIRHLESCFGAQVVKNAEGPDARSWFLEIAGQLVVVHQWDTGDISFFAENASGEHLIENLAQSVRREVE